MVFEVFCSVGYLRLHINNHLTWILANFYNAFMSSGTFPNVLNTDIVSPVYYKRNPQQFDNYRPISTLSIL